VLEDLFNPLRLPQRALEALDSLGDIAQDLGALRAGVSGGLERLEETTLSIDQGMTELSAQLEGLNRMEETTASIDREMTELSERLECLTRMEGAMNDGLAELSARVKRLSKQLEILPTPQLDKGDPFPDFTLEGAHGPVELRERWSEGPLAVAFMRHMGCSFCREHLAQLDQARGEIRAAGGEVVAVFQNRGGDARAFCNERRVGLDCLGDPRREGYGAVALKKGSWKEYIGPAIMMRQLQAIRSGYRPGAPKGDVSQRPGTFVVGTDGLIVFAHYNRDSSDNPTTDAVLAAVREAAGAHADVATTPRTVAIAPLDSTLAEPARDAFDRLARTGDRFQRNGASPEVDTCRSDRRQRLGGGKC